MKGKILIVDDEEEVREATKIHLKDQGYNFLEAGDGEEAVQVLRQGDHMISVGVILCDIEMPKSNGLECIDFFKKNAPGIPVIVISGHSDPEIAVKLMKKGVKDYIAKPVERERLIAKVREAVESKAGVEL